MTFVDDSGFQVELDAEKNKRDLAKYVENQPMLCQIMVDIPGLPCEFVHEELLANEDVKHGLVKPHISS